MGTSLLCWHATGDMRGQEEGLVLKQVYNTHTSNTFYLDVSQVCLSVYMNVLHTYHGQVFKDLDPVSWSHVGHVVEVGWVGD